MEAVVGEPHLLDPGEVRSADRPTKGVRSSEAGVVDQDDQDVRSVLGRLLAGDDRPVPDRLLDRPADRTTEGAVIERQHRAIWIELARCYTERILQPPEPVAVDRGHRLRRRTAQGLLGRQTIVDMDDRHHGRHAGLQILPEPRLEAALEPVLRELAHDPPGGRTDGDRCEQRRRGETDEHADPSTPPGPPTPEMIARLADQDLARLVLLDEDDTLAPDPLGLDASDQLIEVFLRPCTSWVRSHDDFVSIHDTSSDSFRSSDHPTAQGICDATGAVGISEYEVRHDDGIRQNG